VRHADPRSVARGRVSVQAEGLADLDLNPTFRELPKAQLWTLQVGEHGKMAADLDLRLTDIGDGLGVVGMGCRWLKLTRKTSAPARAKATTWAGWALAGPRVATMRARRARIMGWS